MNGVRVEARTPASVRVALRRGLELEVELELDPELGDAFVYLAAPEGSTPPGSELGRRFLAPDEFGRARVEGLTSGTWRFGPDGIRFEPESVTLPCDGPLVLRGARRE